jgi:starch phosphorylase
LTLTDLLNLTVATEITTDSLRESIFRRIRRNLVQLPKAGMTARMVARPLALAIRDIAIDRLLETEERYRSSNAKRVYYLSMEFLIGRCLGDMLCNLRLTEPARTILAELDINLDEVLALEPDAGLGNGGLGRLAACYLESLATLGMPAVGYGIDYQYGLFRQQIVDGYQQEQPDRWKDEGLPMFVDNAEEPYQIPIYGEVQRRSDSKGKCKSAWVNYTTVAGMPHDIGVVGFGGNTVNILRLFSARSREGFNLESFNQGDYIRAIEKKVAHENISRVLYPSDGVSAGKELRLLQEYFLVACSLRDLVKRSMIEKGKWDELPSRAAIQMNDTHPSLAVAELMRMLVDENDLEWERAWEITVATLGYTNHTLMPEALEKWPESLLRRVLPRHTEIIFEINQKLLEAVSRKWPGDYERQRRMSIIEEAGDGKQVRMAHLAIVGSHAVNGVSELHSQLLRSNLAPEFAELWPQRFSNKTNGVAPRLWLLKANPPLSALITECLGDEQWIVDLGRLRALEKFRADSEFLSRLMEVKHQNKVRLAKLVASLTGIKIDPGALFDVHIKRIHEYKRQLLNVMRIVHEYLRLVEDGCDVRVPRAYIFAGKAAPGYWAAKQIVKLIHNVARVVNEDPKVAGRLKVVFVPDYRVSLAEMIVPAADLSEQISTAGMEASGTGNMKLAMNGALTMGTLDGANIELRDEVGENNIYIFGHTAEELVRLRERRTYNPRILYEMVPTHRRIMDALASSRFCQDQPGMFGWIYYSILDQGDRYFHLADLTSYLQVSEFAESEYTDTRLWARKALFNIARIGKFSSDRAVREYAREVWGIQACTAVAAK